MGTHPDTRGRLPETPAGRSRRRTSLRCSGRKLVQERRSHDFLSDIDPRDSRPLRDETGEELVLLQGRAEGRRREDVPSANMEGEGIMSCSVASQQGAVQMFHLHSCVGHL